METFKSYYGWISLACGFGASFLGGIFFGILSVAIDLDHILCAILGQGIWSPSSGQFGCRLLHHWIWDLAFFFLLLSITCAIGFTRDFLVRSNKRRTNEPCYSRRT